MGKMCPSGMTTKDLDKVWKNDNTLTSLYCFDIAYWCCPLISTKVSLHKVRILVIVQHTWWLPKKFSKNPAYVNLSPGFSLIRLPSFGRSCIFLNPSCWIYNTSIFEVSSKIVSIY